MPKYFTHLSHTNQPANALHRSAEAALEEASNRLIDDRDKFIKELKATIDELNARHPRCTPLVVSTSVMWGSDFNIWLGPFTVSFIVYEVNEHSQEAVADAAKT